MLRLVGLATAAVLAVTLSGCSVAPFGEKVVDPGISCSALDALKPSHNVHFDPLYLKTSAQIADLVLSAMDDSQGPDAYKATATSYNGKTHKGASFNFGGDASSRSFTYDLPTSAHVTSASEAESWLQDKLERIGIAHADGLRVTSSSRDGHFAEAFGPGATAGAAQMFNEVALSHDNWLFDDSSAATLDFSDGKPGDTFWTPHVRFSLRPVYAFATDGSLSYGEAEGYGQTAIKCRLDAENSDASTLVVGSLFTGVFDIDGSLAYEINAQYGGPCEGRFHEDHQWSQTLQVDAFSGAILKSSTPGDNCADT